MVSKSSKSSKSVKSVAKTFLQKKIKKNIKETGRYVNPKQAVAVAYSQTSKKFPYSKIAKSVKMIHGEGLQLNQPMIMK